MLVVPFQIDQQVGDLPYKTFDFENRGEVFVGGVVVVVRAFVVSGLAGVFLFGNELI